MPIAVPLSAGLVALVDLADAERILAHKWSASGLSGQRYAVTRLGGKLVAMHRFLMPGQPRIDHCDGDRLNNTRANLRVASASQNSMNMRKKAGASSQFKGVSKLGNVWWARIKANGKARSLGTHHCEVEAARAYDRAARQFFGEFARLNFPGEGL